MKTKKQTLSKEKIEDIIKEKKNLKTKHEVKDDEYEKRGNTFICKKCDKEFSRMDGVKRHIINVHKNNYIFCELCKKDVSIRQYKERHLESCIKKHMLYKYPGSSNWERLVSKYLDTNNIPYKCQYKFEDLKKNKLLSYDFYIKDKNYLIEINGKQHYEKTNYSNSDAIFKRTQHHDQLKKEYANKHNINLLIIDTRKYNTEEKIHSELSKIFILS